MRTDISPNLVHFTSGVDINDAYARFKRIIAAGKLIASGEKIKGGFQCVCFSEAPLLNLASGLVNESAYSRYSPFGFLFSKKLIFSLGGRPVVYQSDSEYLSLPDSLRWRHMRYEPTREPAIDFTWEREWRLPSSELRIEPQSTHLVLPDKAWVDHLLKEHDNMESLKVQSYSLIFDETIAQMYYEPFKWVIWTLK